MYIKYIIKYIYIYIRMYIHICVHTYTYVCIYMCIYTYVYKYIRMCIYIYIYTRMYLHTCIYTLPFKSLGSFRNDFIFQRKALFFNKDNINHKYPLYIVNVVNDYSRWKCLVSNDMSPGV